jgi:CYTH domain-containing protein
MKEIERKFILSRLPDDLATPHHIRQCYLVTTPNEVRIREREGTCLLTIKSDGERERERDETEVFVPIWVFDALWPLCELRIEKNRHTLVAHPYTYEVDVFAGPLLGLLILEVEFPSPEAADAFTLPAWAQSAVEVTQDRRYKNKVLAQYGRPQ